MLYEFGNRLLLSAADVRVDSSHFAFWDMKNDFSSGIFLPRLRRLSHITEQRFDSN